MTKRSITPFRTAAAMLAACIVVGTGAAANAPATNAPPAKKGWESVASAGVTLTSGNSKTFLATIGLNANRKWSHDEILLGASAGYGETTTGTRAPDDNRTDVTQEYVKGFSQYNHLFSARFYGGLRAEGLYDKIAAVDYRFTISPLAGYYIIKEPATSLGVEAGPSIVLEKVGGEENTYLGGRIAERYEYKFKNGAKIWESAEWITQLDEVENWIANAEAGISAPIVKSLDVRLVVQDSYDNRPAPDRLKNDFKLIAGFGYRF
jgi:putative salt-induced outer membrane protein YdiY